MGTAACTTQRPCHQGVDSSRCSLLQTFLESKAYRHYIFSSYPNAHEGKIQNIKGHLIGSQVQPAAALVSQISIKNFPLSGQGIIQCNPFPSLRRTRLEMPRCFYTSKDRALPASPQDHHPWSDQHSIAQIPLSRNFE